ncbi:MAG: hypothetical protein IJU41_06510, partial [Clostridia bacterium]|nr:hypothetical protein [Clostridia bacterium]
MWYFFSRIGKQFFVLLFFSALFSSFAFLFTKKLPAYEEVIRIGAAVLFLIIYLLRLHRWKRRHHLKTYLLVTLPSLMLFAASSGLIWKYARVVFDPLFGLTRVFAPLTAHPAGYKMPFTLFFGSLAFLTLFYPLFKVISDLIANFWMRLFHLKEPFYLSKLLYHLASPFRHFWDFVNSNHFWRLFAMELFFILLFSSIISSLGYLTLAENLLRAPTAARIAAIGITAFVFILYYTV